MQWQVRKALNLFPYEQAFSRSRIITHSKSCGVSALINSQGLYNYNNMSFLQWILQDGDSFFDIGANIGSYTLLASELAKVRVFAFEPHPETFKNLTQNVEINQRQNVMLLNIALGAKDGESFMTSSQKSSLNHLQPIRTADSITVPCCRVDSICQRYGVAPTVIKLDVEGFEYDVLIGFGQTLKQVDLLFIEINGLAQQRGRDECATHQLLEHQNFIGPLTCSFDEKRFVTKTCQGGEDSVYLSHGLYSKLLHLNWAVEHIS